MKAVVRRRYGPPETLQLVDLPDPVPQDDEVMLRVSVTSLNASDWEALTGSPAYARVWGLLTPRHAIIGSDVAGRVIAVGRRAQRFRIGDWVYGDVMGSFGGLGELLCANERLLMPIPEGLDHEVAACLLQGGVVALQGLRAAGGVRAGQHVLVNGAAGASGSYAVQLATAWGAEVTAVDRADKFDYLTQLGARHCIDYLTRDFTLGSERYDVILDLVAQRRLSDVERVLATGGCYVVAGGSLSALLAVLLWGPFYGRLRGKRFRLLAANGTAEDYAELVHLTRQGRLHTHIDRRFALRDAALALRYLGDGHVRGKVVVLPDAL